LPQNLQYNLVLSSRDRDHPPSDLLQQFRDSDKYKELINSTILRGSISETENYYRSLFAQNRDSPELNDPYLMLMNVFEFDYLFQYHPGDASEVCCASYTILIILLE
jgi:hypothetical protein